MGKTKRRKKKVKFSERNYAIRGVFSSILAGISLSTAAGAISLAILMRGSAGMNAAGLSLCSFLIAIAGFFLGLTGFRERDKNYFFTKLGSYCNLAFLVFWVVIFIRGYLLS